MPEKAQNVPGGTMQRRPDFARIRTSLAASMHFRTLGADDLDRLAGLAQIKRLRADERMPVGNNFSIVLSGGLRVASTNAEGAEFVYAVLGPGSFFALGEVIGEPRGGAEAFAYGDTDVAVVDGRGFVELLNEHPRLWQHFAGLLYRRLTLAMMVIRDISSAPLSQRIVRRLLGQAIGAGMDVAGAPVELRLTQADLARMLGASRSKVSLELKRLEGEGLIRIGYRIIRLVDLARLQSLAGPEVFAF
jgi:CRP-like cAMP-binding protein